MKQRLYIDTSVIGGCLDLEFSQWSSQLFELFRHGKKIAVVSDVTLAELEFAPDAVREIIELLPAESKESILKDKLCEKLAELYVNDGAITRRFYEDALHIALATIHQVDVLVSWNFKHIVNLDRIRKYNSVNLKHGYRLLEIRTPREVLE